MIPYIIEIRLYPVETDTSRRMPEWKVFPCGILRTQEELSRSVTELLTIYAQDGARIAIRLRHPPKSKKERRNATSKSDN
jgi:hypothetical protein